MKKKLPVLLILFFSIFNRCKNDISTPPPASYSLINASPDSQGLDFLLDGTPVTTNLVYGQDSGYFSAAPGIHDMVFRKTGTTNDLINLNLSLTAGQSYNLFAIDLVNQLKPVVIANNAPTPPGDSIEVRLLNFYVNSPLLNVQFSGTTDTLRYFSRSFNDQSSDTTRSAFHRIVQDIYTLHIASTDSTLIDSIPNLVLTQGNIYTFYLKGIYGDTAAVNKLSTGILVNQ